MIAHGMLDFR